MQLFLKFTIGLYVQYEYTMSVNTPSQCSPAVSSNFMQASSHSPTFLHPNVVHTILFNYAYKYTHCLSPNSCKSVRSMTMVGNYLIYTIWFECQRRIRKRLVIEITHTIPHRCRRMLVPLARHYTQNTTMMCHFTTKTNKRSTKSRKMMMRAKYQTGIHLQSHA